jgi:hypothetical protein
MDAHPRMVASAPTVEDIVTLLEDKTVHLKDFPVVSHLYPSLLRPDSNLFWTLFVHSSIERKVSAAAVTGICSSSSASAVLRICCCCY